jgi:hypothetical protein
MIVIYGQSGSLIGLLSRFPKISGIIRLIASPSVLKKRILVFFVALT